MRKIYIAGHRGMVGGAILRQLQARERAGEALELITRTHAELDLTSQAAVRDFMDGRATRCGDLGSGKGRRHHGEQHLSR